MLYIHPDECVDCGACEPVCPVEAIFYEDDVPEEWTEYTQANVEFFDDLGSPGGAAKMGIDRPGRSTSSRRFRRRSTTSKSSGAQLPDFPWDTARSATKQRATCCRSGAAPPDGSSTCRSARPVDPDARPSSRTALAAGVRRPRLPDDAGHRRRCARRRRDWIAARRWVPTSTRRTCCRRSAPRSWSRGCRRCSGSAPGRRRGHPAESPTRPTTVGRA